MVVDALLSSNHISHTKTTGVVIISGTLFAFRVLSSDKQVPLQNMILVNIQSS